MIELVEKLGDHAGLILRTSGSSGKPKYVLLDLHKLCEKYKKPRPPLRMIQFMSLDHIGGINTMLYIAFYGEKLIIPKSTSVPDVCQAIQDEKADTLPTTPTFLRLLLMQRAWEEYDLSSLKTITYGTEPMYQSTLTALKEAMPNVNFKQTYGSTEIGIMATKSREDGSLWMKVGGEGYQTRVTNGLLEVKASSAMLGYLNSPSPFTEDGWYQTGDRVEQDGEWYRILGREAEAINIGGEKVSPAELEELIEQIPGIEQAVVSGEKNPITGMLVKAKIYAPTLDLSSCRKLIREHLSLLPPFKVPQKVELSPTPLITDRGKKDRSVLSKTDANSAAGEK